MILLLAIMDCPSDNEGPLDKGRHDSRTVCASEIG
jgi:hypothetical protein